MTYRSFRETATASIKQKTFDDEENSSLKKKQCHSEESGELSHFDSSSDCLSKSFTSFQMGNQTGLLRSDIVQGTQSLAENKNILPNLPHQSFDMNSSIYGTLENLSPNLTSSDLASYGYSKDSISTPDAIPPSSMKISLDLEGGHLGQQMLDNENHKPQSKKQCIISATSHSIHEIVDSLSIPKAPRESIISTSDNVSTPPIDKPKYTSLIHNTPYSLSCLTKTKEDTEIPQPSEATIQTADTEIPLPSEATSKSADSEIPLPSEATIQTADSEIPLPSTATIQTADSEIPQPSEATFQTADSEIPLPSEATIQTADTEIPLPSEATSKTADTEIPLPSEATSKTADTEIPISSEATSKTVDTEIPLPSEATSKTADIKIPISSEETSKTADTEIPLPSEATSKTADTEIPLPSEATSKTADTVINLPSEATSETAHSEIYLQSEATSKTADTVINLPSEATSETAHSEIYLPSETTSETAEKPEDAERQEQAPTMSLPPRRKIRRRKYSFSLQIYSGYMCVRMCVEYIIWAATCDFQRCCILTSVDSDEPVQPPVALPNSKFCSVSSLTLIEYSSD